MGLDWREEVNARKERIDEAGAWKLIAGLKAVRVAKGKQVLAFNPGAKTRGDILAAVMGPSGNLRAPSLLAADTLWVGYNPPLYEELTQALKG